MNESTSSIKKALLLIGIVLFLWLASFFLLKGTEFISNFLSTDIISKTSVPGDSRDILINVDTGVSGVSEIFTGDTFLVNVYIPQGSQITGKNVIASRSVFNFNPDVMQITNIELGPSFAQNALDPTYNEASLINGVISLSHISINGTDVPEAAGSTLLYSFEALAISESTSTSFSTSDMEVIVNDNNGNVESLFVVDGTSLSLNFPIIDSGTSINEPRILSVVYDDESEIVIEGFNLTGTSALILNQISDITVGTVSIFDNNNIDISSNSNQPTRQTMKISNFTYNPLTFPNTQYDFRISYKNGTSVTRSNAITFLDNSPEEFSVNASIFPNTIYKNDQNEFSVYAEVTGENIFDVRLDLTESGIGVNQIVDLELDTISRENKKYYKLESFTLPQLTSLSSGNYKFKVIARQDQSSTKLAESEITLNINSSSNRPQSLGAPRIDSSISTISPQNEVRPGETVSISVFVTDSDGSSDITNVVAVDSQLGIGSITLTAGEVVGIGRWFNGTATIPEDTDDGSYLFKVQASDSSSLTTDGTFQLNYNVASFDGPIIVSNLNTKPRITPNPTTFNTDFEIFAFVESDDLDNVIVTADLSPLKLGVVELESDIQSGKGAWFKSEPQQVSTTVSTGNYDINIRAVDSNNKSDEDEVTLNVTTIDRFRDKPTVVPGSSYTIPSPVPNDGQSIATIYAYVRDTDGYADIDSVVVNLSEIGLAPANQMKVLEDSVEGTGQYYFFEFIVPPTTPSSLIPYSAIVTATDISGARSTATEISIRVAEPGDTIDSTLNIFQSPKIIYALSTSKNRVELGFDPAIDTQSLSRTGREFTITRSSDISNNLTILDATISADGTFVALETEDQESKLPYTVTISSTVESKNGIPVSPGNGDAKSFIGFENNPGVSRFAAAVSIGPKLIEADFTIPIRPSELSLPNFSLYKNQDRNSRIIIDKIKIINPTRIQLSTEDTLNQSTLYTLRTQNLTSYSGSITPNAEINLRGYREGIVGDLDKDGDVDFDDFSIFSAAYTGTISQSQVETNNNIQ